MTRYDIFILEVKMNVKLFAHRKIYIAYDQLSQDYVIRKRVHSVGSQLKCVKTPNS